ncbi:Hypothetical predicted protein [Mytilus galloprovincialis]|uniref:Death domain-containing protein n=1 Tax=Mytilus galloprovincialis TaxID=29158 RepID=A0A8B6FH16_MYTGA|nr:Hypothetical predicted protein [Mytilus galloprovincialis]
MCHGNRRHVEDQEEAINQIEELQLLNRNINFNDLDLEQQDNINTIRHMHVIERNISHVSVTDKPDNNNLARVDSECPSVRFNSDSSVSINRQLSNITVTDRRNSTASENSPLMQVKTNYPCVNRANSVPEIQVLHDGELLVNRQVLNRAESVPQQVSCEEEDGDICISIRNSPVHSPTSLLFPSLTRYPYLENGCGACIPLPDFDNIQSSSPVMNTELPNIAEFKRSLSKGELSAAEIEAEFPWVGKHDDWDKLIAFGTFQSFENRVYLCGCCSCGKSTLASVLIGESIPLKWNSTDGLVIYFGRNGIDLETYEMIPLKEEERGHSVLAKIIRGQPTISNIKSQTGIQWERVPCRSQTTNSAEPFALSSDQYAEAEVKRKTNDTHNNDAETLQSNPSLSIKEDNVIINKCGTGSTDLLHIKKVESYAVHNEILEEIRNGKYRIDIAPSDLVDFGGQRSYDMTHQLFIQHSGSFVVMFDGSKEFTSPLEVYSQGNITAQSITKHWVNSILTYCVEDHDVMPKILFAATHSDYFATQEEREYKKTEFIQKLKQLFGDHKLRSHIVSDTVFFINCTNESDPEIKRLTNRLVEIAKQQPSWGVRRPIIWVPLELQISKMKLDKVNIITKTYLDKANQMNGDLALNEKQLEDFLLAQHSLGKIMYFKDQGLNNFIIIHSPALVNILRSFVTDEIFWPKKQSLKDILKTLTETGKLYKRDLLTLWQQEQYRQYLPNDNIVEFVINVLIHLDVLVVPKTYQDRPDAVVDYFLVPCVVKSKMSSDLLDSTNFENNTITLVYKLKRSSIPSALSFKLIGAVSNIWPVKEQNGESLLYHSSAVLCVNKENEFRVITEDNTIIVYLTNKRSKAFISPDIAASIQECMTTTLQAVMQFYLINIGKYRKEINVSDLFHIEIGEVCHRLPCVKPFSEINETSMWECSLGKQHFTKYPMFWFFHKKQKFCPSGCTGLDKDALALTPSDKHIARLADLLDVNVVKVIVINLGLKENKWNDIEYQYDRIAVVVKIMALLEWRKNSHNSTLGSLSEKLIIEEDNRHLLCKILWEDTALIDQASPCLQETPSEEVLLELRNHIGNCAVHLGIELELDIVNILDSLTRYPRDMKKQLSDILAKWRRSTVLKPTIYRLMLALERVDNGGLDYLKDQYNCN